MADAPTTSKKKGLDPKRLEDRLEIVAALSVTLDHEINNPIAGIVGKVQLIRERLEVLGSRSSRRATPLLDETMKDLESIQALALRITDTLTRLRTLPEPIETEYVPGIRMIALTPKD